ncbi:MAG: 23S rRNA (guanosine(2251)-2'-O)-methyltransferase RlmB [Nitrospirae bacterium CG18_big_fil_WC_8_21_14_2_50_70_55]|nr:23S rRNA (guanosine(2251)-2'-O)-methyltransferase RlmB [Deltaproteobacteria bacterium]OIP66155.1 MAG: 23S rRNA (guanosine(2251)-2'-O)-methyltransferase RlmB [Nitrospirae bacterium CG2_30_70_394]PIQ06903.1 MAG: 23S rRNA (guanosine(2251)-2'-O)-methyltransferase RlmB [Nitrospirae bacterium CG18_big_fil_WC_8_21_14_2_50_70_55]PIU80291.1 MAG: 23S rRNA (guanosine(2251)-2'-O)-methyltransferase RlmB [Nitrospirae bacterium CG06_land_8_20_14_3_00_70_43]PIW83843.1 MAG: 23S rRNA (guanosine(2251)-2'-O)-me
MSRRQPLTPVYGLHAAEAALVAGRGRELWLARKEGEATVRLRQLAEERGVRVRTATAEELRGHAPQGGDQGCLVLATPLERLDLAALVARLAGRRDGLVVLLDRVQDPHNLGSCLRTAACFGVAAVVCPSHRSAAMTPAAVKVASGAAERVPVVAVGSLLDAVERLKGAGVWIFAAEEGAPQAAAAVDLTGPVGLILGGEGSGVRTSVVRAADATVTLTPPSSFTTLNVAAATACFLYEVARQRRAAAEG